jgi:hypothetical protein
MASVVRPTDQGAAVSGSRGSRFARAAVSALRAEDLLLAAWVGLASPLLAQAQGSPDPFAAGRPIDGLFRLAGVVGAFVCLCTRTAGVPPEDDRSILIGGAAGPAVGGLMLVGASAFAGLGLAPEAALLPLFGAVLLLSVLRGVLPPTPPAVRRALVTPFVLAAGGIFWGFIRGITGSGNLFGDPSSLLAQAPAAAPVLGFLTLFAAVYYAMLIYAPRQIAEREGGPLVWIARFALFLASVVLGFGWLGLLGS